MFWDGCSFAKETRAGYALRHALPFPSMGEGQGERATVADYPNAIPAHEPPSFRQKAGIQRAMGSREALQIYRAFSWSAL